MVIRSEARVVATIEARMGSSRLPGKVLMPVLGEPMLMHLVRRLRAVPSLDNIIVATTIKESDEPIVDFCLANNIAFFRGSEDDVLERVIGAGESDNADVLVEITGDCPLIDPDLVEQTIRIYLHNEVDYASNSIVSSYPIGMGTQVISMSVLKASADLTDDPLDREHVSRYLWQRPDQYRFAHLVAPPSLHWPELGLTLDEPGDYLLLKKIIETLSAANPIFSCFDIIQLLRKNPSWLLLNGSVVRKGAD